MFDLLCFEAHWARCRGCGADGLSHGQIAVRHMPISELSYEVRRDLP